jgi:hypothetical protein
VVASGATGPSSDIEGVVQPGRNVRELLDGARLYDSGSSGPSARTASYSAIKSALALTDTYRPHIAITLDARRVVSEAAPIFADNSTRI